VSIPLIAWSSQLVLRLLDRFPIIIYLGGALLGYVAGEMLLSDRNVANLIESAPDILHILLPAACSALVVLAGIWLARRMETATETAGLVDEQASVIQRNKQGQSQ
jgi:predicted tellurium resistance membrane protein TerC